MAFDFACVCSSENKVLRPAFSLDGPDLLPLRSSSPWPDPSGPQVWIALCVVFGGARFSFYHVQLQFPPFMLMLGIVLYYIHRVMLDNMQFSF